MTYREYITYSMIGGAVGGMCESVIVTPTEFVKTRIIHDSNAPVDKRKYKGLIHGVQTILTQEGASGFYKGFSATLLKQSTNQLVRFGVFDSIKYYVTGGPSGHLNFVQNLCTGALAGAVSVVANNPIDVVKSQMQGLDAAKYSGFFDCFKKIASKHGFMFFYRGAMPRLVRVCGDTAISFTAYNELTKILKDWL